MADQTGVRDSQERPDEAGARRRRAAAARLRRGLRLQRRAHPAGAARGVAGVVPGAGGRGRPGAAAGARRAGLGAAARAPGPGPDPVGHGRRADPDRGAVHHLHGHDLDHHRPHARASTAWSATAWRSTARCSTCCAGRSSGRDARGRHPAREAPAGAGLRRPAPAGGDPGRLPLQRLHRRPPRRRPLPRLPGHLRRWWSRPAGCCGPASRSSTPTTRASTRWPTSTAWPTTSTPSWPTSTGWSPTWRRSLPPGAALVVTCRPRPGGGGRPARGARPRRARPAVVPVGRGPVPVAARPARPGRGAARGRPRPTTATRAGCATRDELDRRGLVGSRGHRRGPGPAGRRGPGGQGHGGLLRPRRRRPLRAGQPPRLAHRRPRCACRCWPTTPADGHGLAPPPAASGEGCGHDRCAVRPPSPELLHPDGVTAPEGTPGADGGRVRRRRGAPTASS